MINNEQIQWLMPVFNEAGMLLDTIPEFCIENSYRNICDSYFKEHSDFEFFYDELEGLYRNIHIDRNEYTIEVYGVNKREIIKHIVYAAINNEAYMYYASRIFKEIHPHTPLPCRPTDEFSNQYKTLVCERVSYCCGIVDPQINLIEKQMFPFNEIKHSPIIMRQGRYMTLLSIDDGFKIRINIPSTLDFWRYYLGVLRNEKGHSYGVSFDMNSGNYAIDISRFYKSSDFISLEAVYSLESDRVVLERMELAK